MPGDLREAGTVSFPTSCDASVQSDFNRSVALLHSFFYEESRRIFSSIAERDPSCAMAQWGIAQTWWHPIWAPPRPEEFDAGKAAADRAMAMKATARERGFIEAIAAYYATPNSAPAGPVGQSCHGPIGAPAAVAAYAHGMDLLHERFPDDFEVRTFHAFSMLSVGYATPTDLALSHQKQAGALLEQLWRENPHHPGVAHYIIHSYDYPALAGKALAAAQSYAAIAPWVPHALHMPSHIFTRLGMWNESIDTNRAAAEAARAYASQRGRTASESEELHALDYLAYSLLQQGRDAEAQAIAEKAAGVREIYPAMEFAGAYALAAIPARYALEREAWQEAATVTIPQRVQWQRFPFTEALLEYVHALGRAHTGDVAGARQAIERMRSLQKDATDVRFDYFRRHLELQAQAAEAWLAHAEGRDDDALRSLQSAADAEDALGKHPVSPGALMPVREQLGALFLASNRPSDALTAYRTELAIYPARFRSLYGAGLAAERMSDNELARNYFSQLVKQAPHADGSRMEIVHARKFLEGSTSKS
jgi:tetratricopeptide (TPR) repeat protein